MNMSNKEFDEQLQKKIDEIDRTFQPSTTIEEGNLLDTNWQKWDSEIMPKQEADWRKIKKLLRGTWGKLKWPYKAWVFNHYRAKYNWSGWSTTDGVALALALKKSETKS
jgi:hypothetical protein